MLSCFRSATDTAVVSNEPIGAILSRIASPEWSRICSKIRELHQRGGKAATAALKKQLFAFTPAGEFSRRGIAGWITSSEDVSFDLDNVKDPVAVVAALSQFPWVHYLYISPSGCGVKGAVHVPAMTLPNPTRYTEIWHSVTRWLASLGYVNDKGTQDCSRLAFVSHDVGLFYNPERTAFPLDQWPVPVLAPRPTAPRSPSLNGQRPVIIAQAKAFLATHPPAIDGQNGGGTLYAAATALVHGFGLDREDALDLLWEEYNPRCEGPWSLKELEHKVDDALTKPHDAPPGWLVRSNPDEDFAIPEKTPMAPQAPVIVGVTPSQLFAYETTFDPTMLLGDRWLCQGGSCFIIGQTGLGKSSFSMQAAMQWALGESLFGITPIRPLKSVVIQAENDAGDLAEMIQGVIRGNDYQKKLQHLDQRVTFITEAEVSGVKFIRRVRELVDQFKPDLLWIDPLFAYLGGSASEQETVSKFLRNGLGAIARATGVCFMVVHHTNKPAKAADRAQLNGGDYSYLGSGSAELANWARAVLVLREVDADTFELRAAKRGRRSGLTNTSGAAASEIYLKHGATGICWERGVKPEAEREEAENDLASDVLAAMEPDQTYNRNGIRDIVAQVCGVKPSAVRRVGRKSFRIYEAALKATRVSEGKYRKPATETKEF